MAALRPIVLVFQEFAEVSAAAEEPDLETIIAGPAYHCLDYPADRLETGGNTYGDEDAENQASGGGAAGIPGPGTDALILSDPPGNVTGALLDHSSLNVFMEEALLQVVDGTGSFSTTAPDENLFTSAGGEDFAALGVRPGDRFVTTGVTGPEETVEFVIQEVGGFEGSTLSADQLRMTANYLSDGFDINGDAYSSGDPSSRLFRVERRLDSIQIDSAYIEIVDNQITVEGGIDYLFDIDEDGTDETLQVNYGELYFEYCSLRQDLATVNEIADTGLIETSIGQLDERNPLSVGVFIALQNTVTPVKYFGVTKDNLNGASDRLLGYTNFLDAIEARSDIYCIVPLANELSIIQAAKTHVEGLADPEISKFRIVIGSSEGLPETKTISDASTTGLTEEVASDPVNVFVDTAADFSSSGDDVRSGDTLAIVTDAAATPRVGAFAVDKLIQQGDGFFTETALPGSGAQTAVASYYALRGTGTVQRELANNVGIVSSSSQIDVDDADRDPNDVGRVIRLSGFALAANEDDSPIGNDDYLITAVGAAGSGSAAGTTAYTLEKNGNDWDAASDAGPVSGTILLPQTSAIAVSVTSRRAFRQILDNSATFVSDGVVVGDLVEVPLPPADAASDFSGDVYSAAVAAIVSENRVQLALGSDIPAPDSALGYDGSPNDLGYRILRSLDKAGQVDELVAIVESLASKRVVMVWPDEVRVAGVQNNNTGVQNNLPGFYLACVVGGMSAGLPPHQGFTNIGIAGIEQIFNSTRYFSEGQLEEISNAGWYLFVQETENSTPFSLHQLTTDVSTTQNGELSIVRTFDFVSLFYKDILDDFLGKYNVIDQTLDILRQSINGGTAQLQAQALPRIGAPLISAEIDRIEVLSGQKDRVEIYMFVELPFPLNRIGLHLIA